MGSCFSSSFHSEGNRLGSAQGDDEEQRIEAVSQQRRAQVANSEADRANRLAAAEARQKKEALRGKGQVRQAS